MMSERMSARAQAYLWIRATMSGLLGALIMFAPLAFVGDIYQTFLLLVPNSVAPTLVVWGVAFLALTALLIWAAARGREGLARIALLSSTIVTAAWMASYVAAWVVAGMMAPASIIVWGGLVAIDLVMLRRPLTIPFEDSDFLADELDSIPTR